MNKSIFTLILALVPSVALAQFADKPATAPKRVDENDPANGGADVNAKAGRGAQRPVFGADANMDVAVPRTASQTNRMFDAIDTNGDGVISKAELAKAVVSLRKLDADGDGNLTLAEVSGPTGPVGQAANVNQMVDQTMTQLDKNHDGKLSADEVPAEMAMSLGNPDQNGDGVISRPELAAAMEKMPQLFNGLGGAWRGGAGIGGAPMGQQMMQQMMRYDRNGDGKLTADEVPMQMQAMLQGADANKDGAIDTQEMHAFLAQMGQRGARGAGAEQQQPMGDRGARRGR